jgi:hypothetical protein
MIWLFVSAARDLKRADRLRIEENKQLEAYLASLTHEERMEYLVRTGQAKQARATRRAGLGIAAVIGFGGFFNE